MTVRTGFVDFPSNLAKARYMAEAGAADVLQREVQRWAAVFNKLPLAQRPPAILRFCQYAIDYVRDPKREVLEDSSVTLMRGFGDCDAKARVFVALCRACPYLSRASCPGFSARARGGDDQRTMASRRPDDPQLRH